MSIDLSTSDIKLKTGSSFGVTIALMAGYLLVTGIVTIFLESHVTPPGFTGRGRWAMIVVFVGAFRLAGRCSAKQSWVFLLFGGLGAMLLLLSYNAIQAVTAPASVGSILLGWTVYVVAMSLLTRMIARVRWRLARERKLTSPLCARCGYDLRASTSTCPECGSAFNLADPTTCITTTRHWDFPWLGRLLAIIAGVAVSASLVLAAIYIGFYWQSELPKIAAIRQLGGRVETVNIWPNEWRGLFGPIENLADRATKIVFTNQPLTDDQMVNLKGLTFLQNLHLINTQVTGRGLANLVGLKNLHGLYLPDSHLTDGGMAIIGSLTSVTSLGLTGTKFSDTALEHITRLPALTELWLRNTPMTDNELDAVLRMPSLEYLNLSHTPVTDAQLARLSALKRLKNLLLIGTTVTDTGLRNLVPISSLKAISITGTPITPQAVVEFQLRRPDVDVTGP